MKSTQTVKIWHGNGKNHVRSVQCLGYIQVLRVRSPTETRSIFAPGFHFLEISFKLFGFFQPGTMLYPLPHFTSMLLFAMYGTMQCTVVKLRNLNLLSLVQIENIDRSPIPDSSHLQCRISYDLKARLSGILRLRHYLLLLRLGYV